MIEKYTGNHHRMEIGRFMVTDITHDIMGDFATIQLPGTLHIKILLPDIHGLRAGDLVTWFMDIPIKDEINAQTIRPRQ